VNALVVGCGRVGSSVALGLAREGWNVSVIDEQEQALHRLGDDWAGPFVVGHGMDIDVLREAGIEQADAVVVSTNGDNTNLVISQVARKQFGVATVVARILDPARAQFYSGQGLQIVCPTKTAIDELTRAVLAGQLEKAPA
jgi:trk system potassium uptake protein TrkA